MIVDIPYEFFDEYVPFKEPKIALHDSMLVAKHNYACPVCQENKSIYIINEGIFIPCDICRSEGWKLVQKKSWVPKWLKRRISRR